MTEQLSIVDGHNDLPWRLRERGFYDLERTDIARPQPKLHTDLPRLRAGGVRAQFWSVFVPADPLDYGDHPAAPLTATCEQIDAVHRLVARYPESLRLVQTSVELEDTLQHPGGPIASLLGAEGGHCIDNSLGALRTLYRLGVRYLTLTHNKTIDWADAATDAPRHGGLTGFGCDVVKEMNRLGMMVDLSHTAPTTMADALEVSTVPVIFSHSSARSVTDHPRNVPDDILTKMASAGGVCMVTFVPAFVSTAVAEWQAEFQAAAQAAGVRQWTPEGERFAGEYPVPRPQASLAEVVAHCERVREVAGIEHIGVGGDFDGTDWLPSGLEDVSCYPRLSQALREAKWSADDLERFGWRNICRVFRDVEAGASTSTRGDASV